MRGFLLPRWVDRIRPLLAVALALGPLYLIGLAYFVGSPRTTDVGYTPKQPVPFSHALHAGELGLDCRYCHTSVESAPSCGHTLHGNLHELPHSGCHK